MQPGQHVAPPVADFLAHPEAARRGAQVSPVALRRHGSSKEGGDFVDGQQFVVELDGVVGVGHGVLLGGSIDHTGPTRTRERTRLGCKILLVSHIVTRYSVFVIVSFRHKGLERLYRDGSKKGVQAAHVDKLQRILSLLDVAQSSDDLTVPSFRIHPLKGKLVGRWPIWVSGNWRVTFRFVEQDVELVDYQDNH